ncbi:hypothetical protein CEXT_297281 [Caerostris extrusa]|uniref:Uncharacterized protein n=1 Tax=Caerostris extrusa TaxID=172846 RepID=A0AAV4MFA6_CAEEX|nr:hypothetical protein CEXT_297281 [Caerostris extrusa]
MICLQTPSSPPKNTEAAHLRSLGQTRYGWRNFEKERKKHPIETEDIEISTSGMFRCRHCRESIQEANSVPSNSWDETPYR